MGNHLEIDSVYKKINDRILLSDIYLKIESPEIIAVFGKNGSGKSTLFKIIYGVESAENSQIRFNNVIHKKLYKTKNLISYSTQELFLPDNMVTTTVLRIFFYEKIPLEISERFSNVWNTRIGNLSGGEKKMLQLYIILHTKSKFIILDEPFTHLTPIAVEEIKKAIKQNSEGKCIMISDHSYENVMDIATRTYLLNDGSLKQIKKSTDLLESSYIKSNFG